MYILCIYIINKHTSLHEWIKIVTFVQLFEYARKQLINIDFSHLYN